MKIIMLSLEKIMSTDYADYTDRTKPDKGKFDRNRFLPLVNLCNQRNLRMVLTLLPGVDALLRFVDCFVDLINRRLAKTSLV